MARVDRSLHPDGAGGNGNVHSSGIEVMPQASGLQFTARVGEFPTDHFVVVSFVLTGGLSSLSHGRLKLASTDPDVQTADMLERRVDLVVWQDGQPQRRFTGGVNEFARGHTGHRRAHYEHVIQHPAW